MDLNAQVAQNTRDNIINNNKRGATIARVCGEEHTATAHNGMANIFLTCDNDLCYISDYKFKLVFNGGSADAWINMPVPTKYVTGIKTWSSYTAFQQYYPIGSALDVDGYYGCQCVDYANAFWVGMTGRRIDCGGDNARGIWEQSMTYNKGTEFDTGQNWTSIRAGDWVVWGNGKYGHIAMAIAAPSGNTLRVWEQNGSNGQGWPTGGKTLAEGTVSKDGFLGYFRYKY